MRGITLLVAGLLCLATTTAIADAGATKWMAAGSSSASMTAVSSGNEVRYEFSSAANSAVLHVNADRATACFDSDTSAETTLANSVQFRVVPFGETTAEESLAVSSLLLNDSECVQLSRGYYYADVTWASGTARVVVTAERY